MPSDLMKQAKGETGYVYTSCSIDLYDNQQSIFVTIL